MDDKNFDELLRGMKDSYEEIPEFLDKQELIQKVEMKQKQSLWKRTLPSLAAVAGLGLFVIMTLIFINTEPEQAEPAESNDTNQAETGEEIEIDEGVDEEELEELEAYLEEAKERFREELGMENIDALNEVSRAQESIQIFKDTHAQSFKVDDGKTWIDDIFITPKTAIAEMDHYNLEAYQKNPEQFESDLHGLYSRLRNFSFSFDRYLGSLLAEHKIELAEQHTILKSQDALETYNGPEEVKEFIRVIKEQGYEINRHPDKDRLYVSLDQERMAEHVSSWEVKELYKDYFLVLTKMVQLPTDGGNLFGIAWEEQDSLLLELEDLMNEYDEDISEGFQVDIYINASEILNNYIGANTRYNKQIPEEVRADLQSFVENHKDSMYWGIVNEAVQLYQDNDWKKIDYRITADDLRILLDERFQGITSENIMNVEGSAFHQYPFNLYNEYEAELDQSVLEELSAEDVLKLYVFSVVEEEDVDVYGSLLSEESNLSDLSEEELRDQLDKDWNDFYSIVYESNRIVVQRAKEDSITYSFVTGYYIDYKVAGNITMKKEEGIWKVSDYEFSE
ncbi:hypothetical protein SAMN05216389_10944 [Oceanobacillus limi]|uniref:Uncharacterized protein n=1 Tax=Oceanobacillus limi TaxID=930131 RepID=A0A1I0DPS7_9BACI|nr:hypothetical protein [Oceanobacillus limi]SET33739.1 hypothetical protein SAMN05216389_10944 [Oceanobacillus limi]